MSSTSTGSCLKRLGEILSRWTKQRSDISSNTRRLLCDLLLSKLWICYVLRVVSCCCMLVGQNVAMSDRSLSYYIDNPSIEA